MCGDEILLTSGVLIMQLVVKTHISLQCGVILRGHEAGEGLRGIEFLVQAEVKLSRPCRNQESSLLLTN